MRVGIDIVEINQVKKVRNLERFLDRFFALEELRYIRAKAKKEQTIAGIFAGKEAVLKALEVGIGKIPLKKVIIAHKDNCAPYLVMNEEITSLLAEYGYQSADISISHGGNYSVAMCSLVPFNKKK